MSDDVTYYAARATEERRLAMASRDPKVRAIHLEMAAKYAALASGCDGTQQVRDDAQQVPPADQQKTA